MKIQLTRPRRYVYALLLILVLLGYAGTFLAWQQERAAVNRLNEDLLQSNEAAAIHQNVANYYSPAIIPSEGAVYLPLAKLKLPATPLAQTLLYTYTDAYKIPGDAKVFPAQLSLTTHDLAVNGISTTKQFDCSQVAYADFVTPSYAVNPMYKLAGSVKLSDARTMHVYYAPSIPGCGQSWKMLQIDPLAIANTALKATSY